MMQILLIFCDPSLRHILQPLSNNILENKLVSDDHMAKPPRLAWLDNPGFMERFSYVHQTQRKPNCHYKQCGGGENVKIVGKHHRTR